MADPPMRHANPRPPVTQARWRQHIAGCVIAVLAVILIPQIHDVALMVVVGGVLALGGAVGL